MFSNPDRLAPNDVVTLDMYSGASAYPALGWFPCLSVWWFFAALVSVFPGVYLFSKSHSPAQPWGDTAAHLFSTDTNT